MSEVHIIFVTTHENERPAQYSLSNITKENEDRVESNSVMTSLRVWVHRCFLEPIFMCTNDHWLNIPATTLLTDRIKREIRAIYARQVQLFNANVVWFGATQQKGKKKM